MSGGSAKAFSKTLKTRLPYRALLNNMFLIATGAVLLLFALNHLLFWLVLIIYLLYLRKHGRILFRVTLVTGILIVLFYFVQNYVNRDRHYDCFTGVVVDIQRRSSSNKILLKKGFFKAIVYDGDFSNVGIGDRLTVRGTNLPITGNRLPGLFNLRNYYRGRHIVSVIKAETIETKPGRNVYLLRRFVYDYINNCFDDVSAPYVLGMVLGDSTLIDESAREGIRINGISHLFAVSGLHISLLAGMLGKLLGCLKIKERTGENIIGIVLGFYLLITDFAVSVRRAVFMFYLKAAAKRLGLGLSSADIVSFIFLVMIVLNPFLMYHLSFILSFGASTGIIFISRTLSALKVKLSPFLQIVLITALLQILTFPVIINLNNEFNFLSFLTNGVFIFLVSMLVLPVTFITLFLPFLSRPYTYMIKSFIGLNDFFAGRMALSFPFPSFDAWEILLFYLFAGMSVYAFRIKKSRIICLLLFLGFCCCHYMKTDLNFKGNIWFTDIPEGDCTIIDLPMGRGVVVIDTGTEYCTDIPRFLKSRGIRTIDYLVLTHHHDDHDGNAGKILSEFKVKKIVTSTWNRHFYGSPAVKLKAGDCFTIGGYRFNVLGPEYDSGDENANSLIITVKLGNWNYLFLADATRKNEEALIKHNLRIDCVKVAHHGSSTGSSPEFYRTLSPRYAFIEVGNRNKFGFPHRETLNTLSGSRIYRTDLDYTVTVRFGFARSRIKTLNRDKKR